MAAKRRNYPEMEGQPQPFPQQPQGPGYSSLSDPSYPPPPPGAYPPPGAGFSTPPPSFQPQLQPQQPVGPSQNPFPNYLPPSFPSFVPPPQQPPLPHQQAPPPPPPFSSTQPPSFPPPQGMPQPGSWASAPPFQPQSLPQPPPFQQQFPPIGGPTPPPGPPGPPGPSLTTPPPPAPIGQFPPGPAFPNQLPTLQPQPPVGHHATGRRAYPEEQQIDNASHRFQNLNLNQQTLPHGDRQPQIYNTPYNPAVQTHFQGPPPPGGPQPSVNQGYPPTQGEELYRVNPGAQCPPKFLRMTINAVPQTTGLLSRSSIPFGAVLHPLASSDPEEVPVVDFGTIGIVRCRRCRAYINPFVMFTEGGRRWRCNLCQMINDVPNEYVAPLDANGRRVDQHARKELNYGCIEFIAPLEYTVRPPMPPVYFFVLDVSYYAIISGMLDAAVNTIRAHLKELPGNPRTQIGFLTFDNTVHFYSLKASLIKPHMMVVPDIDDLFLPVPDDLLVNLNDSMHVVEALLDSLPLTFQANQRVESALGPALRAAYGVMKNLGGRMIVFQSSLPSLGVAALKNREGPKPSTDKELALLRPADQFYKNLALDCSRQQISVDLFLMPPGYVDVPTLSCMPQFTGGQTFYYPPGELQQKIEKLRRDLAHSLTRTQGFEAVMRVRCGKGLRVQTHFGNHFIKSTDLLALPNIDSDKAFGIQLELTDGLASLKHISLQAALLYTSTTGERRIRAMNVCLPVTSQLSDIYKFCDTDAIINLTAKMAIERALNASKLSEAREAVLNQCIDILVEYRNNFAKGSPQLSTPPTLHLLPLFTFALIKNSVIRAGEMRSDERSYAMNLLRTLPVSLSEPFIYPRLFNISNMPPHVVVPDNGELTLPPTLELQSENIARDQAYLLDDGQSLYLWVGKLIPADFLHQVFGVSSHEALDTSAPVLFVETPVANRIQMLVSHLRSQRPLFQRLFVVKEGDGWEYKFTSLLIYDRTKAFTTTYAEFLRELQKLVASKSSSR